LALKIVLGGEVLYSIDRKLGRMKVIRLKERDFKRKKKRKRKEQETSGCSFFSPSMVAG
jgi:hypothetical protein